MPRKTRRCPGGLAYHVINRATARQRIFDDADDYLAFERVLAAARQRAAARVRVCCYVIMPNHFHLVLRPSEDQALSGFMKWLTLTHAQRWHAHRHSAGTGLVARAEQWPWGSLHKRDPACTHKPGAAELLDDWPVNRRRNWIDWVNQPESPEELAALRTCLRRERPYGDEPWARAVAQRLGSQQSLRPMGRPKAKSASCEEWKIEL